MRFIQRDSNKNIVGDFAQLQPGIAEEEIDESAPEYLAWLEPPPTDPTLAGIGADKGLCALREVLNGTPQQIQQYVNNSITDFGGVRLMLRSILYLLVLILKHKA